MPKDYRKHDVVIIGAGPVGLLLSVLLTRWGYNVRHIDNRPVPTATGRADGIQPRTLEILKNMGLKRNIMAFDPARVFEVAFWDPAPGGKIVRTGTWASCPAFLDARYPFTALLHQGLIERVMIDDLRKNGNDVQRPWTITRFETNNVDKDYPVEVDLKNLDSNVTETVRAKYLFSGEGARSFVREQLQVPIRHKDPISHVWGVMDGVLRTNFPDIKMKCTIHSDHGSIMVIPREDNMVRLYIQIASSTDPDFNPRKTATVEEVQTAAKNIFQPYYCEWDRVEWYSVYPIGQGIAEKYTLDHRVFMGGDVCHTHSPKAGQGMNTAFHDALNLAWKLHHVESGFADRSILTTYETERKSVAETLLDFDNKYAALFSQRQPSSSEVHSASNSDTSSHTNTSAPEDENPFVAMFKANCEFTAGYGVAYKPNILNHSADHTFQHPLLLTNHPKLRTGRILPNSNATRVADANFVHLENEIPCNGSYRLFVFAGRNSSPKKDQHPQLTAFANAMQDPKSFYSRFAYPTSNRDTHHEMDNPHSPLFSIALVLAAKRSEIEISDLPALFHDYSGRIYADDVWQRAVADAKAPAHAKTGFEGEEGGVVVVRPDGHVACAVRLVGEETVEALEGYFATFLHKQLVQTVKTEVSPAKVRAQL
ncbi:Phenol 2-monooxygenase [Cyphellophora attinorum]|uniref:Phenol 2-monooxygenase n=1 Tax=Cyphellophora attinorum TaxID=1664694 RepID=A0A0N1H6S0_9EURO|nr:Phenol 2-monooxygenase [Phialophora attinorum]KPI38063.1 Phenol 2-monooxygenase [Phialophora attinorum]